ncbi:MAG TPA: hypothetical protein VF247_09730 [Candidatus Krumholzibacteria bacterium]
MDVHVRAIVRRILLCAAVGAMVLASSCGDDNPTTPNDNPPPQNTGIPPVPNMLDPDTDPPTRSETLSVIRKASDFAPLVDAANCSWVIQGRGRFESASGGWVDCYGEWQNLWSGTAWSNGDIPDYHGCFDACGLLTNYCPDNWTLSIDDWPSDTPRFVFLKDDVKDPMPNMIEWDAAEVEICRESLPVIGCINKVWITARYQGTGPAIEKAPYIKRDRFWMSVPWGTGAMVERTTGNESIALSSTYTTGCSRTETESFAYSLGATVGAEYKGIKAEVEGSITRTFGSSFTVMEQEERSISKTLQGEAGKRTCFVMWVLVEQYSFVDKDGNPFVDPNYVLDPGFYDEAGDRYYAFCVTGTQYEIGKYIFNLETNQLVSTEFLPVN